MPDPGPDPGSHPRFRAMVTLALVGAMTLFAAMGRTSFVAHAGRTQEPAGLAAPAAPDTLNWQIEPIDGATGTLYFGNSLALDATGQPRVAYYDPGAGDLRYGTRDGSGWHTAPVDTGGDVGEYTSLALDGGGYPHVSYYDASNLHLKFASSDGTSWTPETVDAATYTGASTSLALDSADSPHISYYRGGSCTDGSDLWCNLRYTSNDGGWDNTRLHYSTAKLGQASSLALDSNGEPHISYYHADNGDLRYLYHTASGWQWDRAIADSAGNTGADTSLQLDDSDHPHVSYWNVDASDLMYATHNGTSWITHTVDSAGSVGRSTSLALDAAGHPHISYYDLSNDTLKYAYYDGADWHAETVTSTGNVTGREGTSLALDGASMPHISFYTTSGLRYATVEPRHTYLPLALRGYPAPAARYAVVVGVSDYLYDTLPPPCMLEDLPYPREDALAVEQVLLEHGGFEAANVLTLVDSAATKAAIEDAITNWLASRAGPDDLVVVYFGGHGGQLGDVFPYYDEADGVDEFLIPHDWTCSGTETAIADDELDTWLDALESQHVVLMIDSCHSGGFIAAGASVESSCRCRCVPPPPGVAPLPVPGDGLIRDVDQGGRLVLAAAEEDSYSFECDSLQHGVFSYYLLQALHATAADTHDGNGWVSGEEAFDYLDPRVQAEMCYAPWSQFPQISDGIPGEEDLTQP
jgi:uncharacterized caspase-like protein